MRPTTVFIFFGRGAMILAAIGVATIVAAQEYRIDKEDREANQKIPVDQSVREPATYAANKSKVADYFSKYYFPMMTRTSPEALGELGKKRTDFFKNYVWATSNEQMQSDLTALAFAAMKNVLLAKDPPYHPAVRYNAVLILGMLDAQYSAEGANRRPPTPLPEANDLLTKIVSAAADDKPVPPPVTLGAVIGLERHAQYRDSLPKRAPDAMAAALLKLVSREQPIQEMDPDAYLWLRLRAASAMVQLGNPGANGEIHGAIMKLVADGKSLDDRTAALGLLWKLKYEGAKIDSGATTEGIFKLARDLAAAEEKRAREVEDTAVSGTGRPLYDPNASDQRLPRRQILARLADLRRGMQKVKLALPKESQEKIDKVDKAIDPVIKAVSDKNKTDLEVTQAIHVMANVIETATASGDAPAGEKAVATPEKAATDKPADEKPAAEAAAGAQNPPPAVAPPQQ